jgi:putative DNA primase/helicase
MVALGSILGRKLGIRLKQHDDWAEYANVWGAIIGPPSDLKSPAMREAMRPLKALQATADAQYREAMAGYESSLEGFKLQRSAKKKRAVKALEKNLTAEIDLGCEGPDEPIARTYWTSDATAER